MLQKARLQSKVIRPVHNHRPTTAQVYTSTICPNYLTRLNNMNILWFALSIKAYSFSTSSLSKSCFVHGTSSECDLKSWSYRMPKMLWHRKFMMMVIQHKCSKEDRHNIQNKIFKMSSDVNAT